MAETQSTGERPPSKARDEIIREAKRLEESTLHSFKGHHCAASGWQSRHLVLGIPMVILSTVVGAAAFSKYSTEYPWVGVVGGILSITVAVLSAITTFLNPNEKENAHFSAAHGYDKLNNDSRIFWSIECWQEESTELLASQLKSLVDKKNELNSTSPQIPDWAYKKAKKGIADGEASFEVDKPGLTTMNASPLGLPFNRTGPTTAVAAPQVQPVAASDAISVENPGNDVSRTS
jgi:hypothetical protein